MSKRYHVVGVDCGASGGKMVSAYFDGERLTENEYIPFPNRSVRVLDSLYHDFFSLYNHSLDGPGPDRFPIRRPRYYWL